MNREQAHEILMKYMEGENYERTGQEAGAG